MRRDYQQIWQTCHHCPNGDFCRKHGCVAWNDEARNEYDRWKKAAADFDAKEADYGEHCGAYRGNWRRRRRGA